MNGIIEIPDKDKLYYRVHAIYFRDGGIMPGAFRERVDEDDANDYGMSTDWAEYSTAEETRNRAQNPRQNAVVSFITGELKTLKLLVVYYPKEDNPAHTNVRGINTIIRRELIKKFRMEIELGN
jgi:hypothetical protein